MDAQHAYLALTINGERRELAVDTRATLLDVLREQPELTGAQKGCGHGQGGPCAVLVDGRVGPCAWMHSTRIWRSRSTENGVSSPWTRGPRCSTSCASSRSSRAPRRAAATARAAPARCSSTAG